MDQEERLIKLLRSRGLRITQPRRVVFEFLINRAEPVKLNQIIGLSGNWADRASLYRTVKLFRDLGILTEVHRPGGDWLELGEDFSPHHHHLTCSQCGYSQTLTSVPLEETISTLAKNVGFLPTDHHLEISGVCNDCLAISNNQQVIK